MINYKILKRFLDFLFALLLLCVLFPLLIIIAIITSITNNGHSFFYQKRPGKNEKIFKIIKLKTMTDLEPGVNSDNDLMRVTKIGQVLRKYSLDEIPQLINVLKGDMSIVGPRPLLVNYLPLYNSKQRKRHDVRPGITGWAQVKGRNALSWEQKFEYDLWYLKNQSLSLDFKILLLIIKRLLLPEDIDSGENVNLNEFKGTKNE